MPSRARVTLAIGLAVTLAAVVFLASGAPSTGRRSAAPPPTPRREPPAPPVAQASVPPRPVAAAAPGAPPSSPRAPAATPAPPDPEAALTERLRALVDADPATAVSVTEEGERRFPAGSLADERSFLKMRALVHLGRIGAARDEAEAFFERFPESPYGASAYRLTGVHPRPQPPSSDTGR